MPNVHIPGSKRFYSQIQMHTSTQNDDVSLVNCFQQRISKDHRKNCVFDQGKNKKLTSEIKWTDREYHVQDNPDFAHKDVKMYCNTKKFPA